MSIYSSVFIEPEPNFKILEFGATATCFMGSGLLGGPAELSAIVVLLPDISWRWNICFFL